MGKPKISKEAYRRWAVVALLIWAYIAIKRTFFHDSYLAGYKPGLAEFIFWFGPPLMALEYWFRFLRNRAK